MGSTLVERFCADCGEVRDFATPPCEDGHGEDCLDLACVECGFALTGATWLVTEHVVHVAAA